MRKLAICATESEVPHARLAQSLTHRRNHCRIADRRRRWRRRVLVDAQQRRADGAGERSRHRSKGLRQQDSQGCVDESISRYKKEPGFSSAISNAIFMRTCLDASKPTPGFCNDVPKKTEFMKSAEWRRDQCSRIDLSKDSYCQQLFQPVQDFCEKGPSRT